MIVIQAMALNFRSTPVVVGDLTLRGMRIFDWVSVLWFSCVRALRTLEDVEMSVRCKKWWYNVFLGLLDMCLVNAFVIYKHKHPTFEHYDFMSLVHEGLLTSVFASGVPRQISTWQGSNTTHTLVAKAQGKQRQCVVCGSRSGAQPHEAEKD